MASAMGSTRSRIRSTAFSMTRARCSGAVRRHTWKPAAAAASASARSAGLACGTVPMTVSSDGSRMGWPPVPARHSLPISRRICG
jgi:hypothetical protein